MRIDDTEQDAAQHESLRREKIGNGDEDEEDSDDNDDAGEAEEREALPASAGAGACHSPTQAICAFQPWQTRRLI